MRDRVGQVLATAVLTATTLPVLASAAACACMPVRNRAAARTARTARTGPYSASGVECRGRDGNVRVDHLSC